MVLLRSHPNAKTQLAWPWKRSEVGAKEKSGPQRRLGLNFMHEIEFDGRRPLRRPTNARETSKRHGSTMIHMDIRLRPDLGM